MAISDPVSGNFQLAMYSLATMYELDGAPELMGYQVTDHTGAIAAPRLWVHLGTAALLPFDAQLVLTLSILLLLPKHPHATVFIRKRAVFCRIGHELMEYHANHLASVGT